MGVRPRTIAADPPRTEPDLEDVVKVLARMVCHLAIRATRSPHPATFKQIAVNELGIASPAEADLLENFLRG